MRNFNALLLILSTCILVCSQASSQSEDVFFDSQTILAMVIGAVAGVLGTLLFQRRKEK